VKEKSWKSETNRSR